MIPDARLDELERLAGEHDAALVAYHAACNSEGGPGPDLGRACEEATDALVTLASAAVPELVAEVRKLKAENERLQLRVSSLQVMGYLP